MRVHVVDPSAFTPPYDHALCRALATAGADVELYTSRFAYGAVAAPEGYERRETFYRLAAHARQPAVRRFAKLAEHVPDMVRYRRAARDADVVHFQWLTVQQLDRHLLPANRSADGARRPRVLTAHDVLPREPRPGQRRAQRRLYDRFDAIVVHTEHGRHRLTAELGVDPARVHVIAHGVLGHLAEDQPAAPPAKPEKPLVLCFGLMRPYKGIDVLLQAWRGIEDAQLWIVGMPRMDITALRAAAPPGVHFEARYVAQQELPEWFRRAALVVLPYREIDQSGVLFTALAFGKPLVLSDAGGFPEMEATGAARIVPAGDAEALHGALRALLDEPAALLEMEQLARAAAEGKYAWATIASTTLDLYASLLRENHRR